MSSRHTERMEEQSSNSNSHFGQDTSLPLLSKIEEAHIHNLENIVTTLAEIVKKLIAALEEEDIILNDKIIHPKTIVSIKDANNQLKYHRKINPTQAQLSQKYISEDLDSLISVLAKVKTQQNETILPKVRRIQDLHGSGLASQLSTIVQKQSQQNLLHSYLRKQSHRKRSKSNINKNLIYNSSSIEDIQFEVIREQTRKSLDNPYYKNNQNRKGLYNDLQKLKGQDNLLPAVKNYLDKHRKHSDIKAKLAPYQIQKFL